MTVNIDLIKETALTVKGQREAYNSCYEINKEILDAVKTVHGISGQLVEGEFRELDYEGIRSVDGHYFVFIDSSELTDLDENIIIDGAVEQFNDVNVKDERKDITVSIEKCASEIESVKITFESDDFYRRYGI